MNIAIIGTGQIGSAFAFQLARTGHHEVTVIARPGSIRLTQLQRDRGIVHVNGERADVSVADALDEQFSYDLVVVTLLAHQAGVVLPALNRSLAQCIVFMFNTFDPQLLRDTLAERCTFGMPFLQATLDAQGKLKTTIGALGQKTKFAEQRLADVFNAAGLPAVVEPDMLLWLRCHVPMCVAFESVCVAGVRRGGGASWGESMTIARGVREAYTLIERLGFAIYPSGKARISGNPQWLVAAILWSMSRVPSFRSLLAGGEGECRALIDVMLASAANISPPIRVQAIEAMKPV